LGRIYHLYNNRAAKGIAQIVVVTSLSVAGQTNAMAISDIYIIIEEHVTLFLTGR